MPATLPSLALEELQARWPEARRSDLARFLRARRENVDHASTMYSKYLEWFQESFPLSLDAATTDLINRRVLYQLPGAAIDGSSIIVFHGTHHQPAHHSTDQTLKMILYVVSDLLSRRDPCDLRWSLLIFAPTGTPFDLKLIKAAARLFSDNYPETLSKVLVFPVGSWTPALWRMARVFLDPRTADKVVLLPGGTRPPELPEHIPVDSIPAQFLTKEARIKRGSGPEPELLPALQAPGRKPTSAQQDSIVPALQPSVVAGACLEPPGREPAPPSPPPPPPPNTGALVVAALAFVAWAGMQFHGASSFSSKLYSLQRLHAIGIITGTPLVVIFVIVVLVVYVVGIKRWRQQLLNMPQYAKGTAAGAPNKRPLLRPPKKPS